MKRRDDSWPAGWLPAVLLVVILALGCGGAPDDEAPGQASGEPEAAAPAEPAPAPEPAADLEGDPEEGKTAYVTYCSSCHGPDATGVKGLGKNLVTSQFVAEKSDAELLAYVKQGRGIDDPLNTTGVPMPPKGGNPALTDGEIADIIAYIRSIHSF